MSVSGLILAGGQGKRMGFADKALLPFRGTTLIGNAIARAMPQVDRLIINANGDPGRFAAFGLPVIADAVEDYAGPLAGLLTGLAFVRAQNPGAAWLAAFACDTPFFPADIVARLIRAAQDKGVEIAVPETAGRNHPTFVLLSTKIGDEPRDILVRQQLSSVNAWIARRAHVRVGFPAEDFFNVNTPGDLAAAERLASQL